MELCVEGQYCVTLRNALETQQVVAGSTYVSGLLFNLSSLFFFLVFYLMNVQKFFFFQKLDQWYRKKIILLDFHAFSSLLS
jgi:hypothetical protein